MKKPRIAFQTFGCKLNFSETSTLSRKFQEQGYNTISHKEKADIYVIHTCSVTGNAEKKCRAAIRQSKKRNPEAIIAVIGCFAQLKPDELASFEEVNLILGNNEKYQLYEHLEKYISEEPGSKDKIFTSDIINSNKFIPAYSSGDRTRSFLKIQDGCDYFCAYCTIPFARGNSRSNTIFQTIKTAKETAKTKAREIILTGVNIGDFGKQHNETLYKLMQELEKLEGIDRIRISSIEPDLLSEEMIRFIANANMFLPHFHIPLQSASDKILRAMNRKYSVDLFNSRLITIKEKIPHACIAADVIVGFPGETNDDFEKTYDFLDRSGISYLHVFTYSARPNTRAAEMRNTVPFIVKKERSRRLHKLSCKKKEAFYKENMGRKAKVLFESCNHNGYIQGFTENYIRVKARYDKSLNNQIVNVKLNKLDDDGIFLHQEKW